MGCILLKRLSTCIAEVCIEACALHSLLGKFVLCSVVFESKGGAGPKSEIVPFGVGVVRFTSV